MSHVPHTNASRHTRGWVMSHIWKTSYKQIWVSHVSHIYEPCPSFEFVMPCVRCAKRSHDRIPSKPPTNRWGVGDTHWGTLHYVWISAQVCVAVCVAECVVACVAECTAVCGAVWVGGHTSRHPPLCLGPCSGLCCSVCCRVCCSVFCSVCCSMGWGTHIESPSTMFGSVLRCVLQCVLQSVL